MFQMNQNQKTAWEEFQQNQAELLTDRPKKPLEDLFDEEPVALDVFIKDKKYLNSSWSLSPIQNQLVQAVERVYLPELYPVLAKEFGGYWKTVERHRMSNLLAVEWGKGAGKDHTVRIAALRVAYLLLCLKSPQDYFSMPEQDSIHILNVAANAPQANRAFFKPLTRAVKTGWFADKAEPKRDTIEFAKGLEAISGHSDAESQEGLNIILGVVDEVDAFRTKAELIGQGNKARESSNTAESILEMIKSSASTRFPFSYKRVAISYPRYIGSTIQRLNGEAKKDLEEYPKDSIYFSSGPFPTWEVNPRIPGKHAFASDYRKDPVGAAAKYECKPFRATSPYFRNPEIFDGSVDRKEQPIEVGYRIATHTSDVTGETVKGWEPVYSFSEDFKPIPGARYVMHADLAVNGDRAGISMSHVTSWKEIEILDGEDKSVREEMRPSVRNDFTFGFESDSGETPPREIQIRWARELAFQLIARGFYIVEFSFDSYQSTDSLQILESHGIKTIRRSTDRDQSIWKSLKDVASEDRLRMPDNELLLDELEGLNSVKGKVDHPPQGSKDLADALACSVVGALNAGGEESNSQAIVSSEESILEAGQMGEIPIGMENAIFGMPLGLGTYGGFSGY